MNYANMMWIWGWSPIVSKSRMQITCLRTVIFCSGHSCLPSTKCATGDSGCTSKSKPVIRKCHVPKVLFTAFSPMVGCGLCTLRSDVFQDPWGYENCGQFPTLLAHSLLCFQAESPMEPNIIIFYFVFITQGVLSVKWLPVGWGRMDLFAPLQFYGPEWQNNPLWNSHFVFFLRQTLWTPPFGTGSLWKCKAKIQPCIFWTSLEYYNILGDWVASGKALSPGETQISFEERGEGRLHPGSFEILGLSLPKKSSFPSNKR